MIKFVIIKLICAATLASLTGAVSAADLHGLRVLSDNCFRCHGAEKRKGDLVLDSREGMMKGGDTGDVIDLDSPAESMIYKLLAKNADPHMPPKKQLSDAEIEAVKDWIKGGAKWDKKVLEEAPVKAIIWANLPDIYRPVAAVAASKTHFAVGRGNVVEVFKPGEKEPQRIKELKGHRDVVQSLAFSPDGKHLASGGFRRLVLWNVDSGKEGRTIDEGFNGRVTALTFAGEGRFLVAADSLATRSGRLHVFDTKERKRIKTIKAHADAIYSLSTSVDGNFVVSASADKLAKTWRVKDWERSGTFEGHTGYVFDAGFSPKGDRLATVSADTKVKIWDVKTRKQISEFNSGTELALTGIFWMLDPGKEKPKDDENWIIAISEDGKPRAYTNLVLHDGQQRSTGAKMRTWSGAEGELTALAYSPANKQVITGDSHGGVGIWDIKGKLLKRLE
ncbi:MAG: hypothetical protein CMO80_21060 [Verrucomicrobiales bacterium]|nr:hypothetical protein [Verrucomicrobiales bacterium]